ncbi:MAG: HepT-like ribonuclease domain-containing protein [Acidobacteriota bacterium]|jgi:uncharacterized protein with HEPN domain
MPREQGDESYLWDMLQAARLVVTFVRGVTLDEYCDNQMLRMAVERALEILGEAANRVSGNYRSAHGEIPWRQIIAQRNVLVHEYGEVDDERIWNLVVHQVPVLYELLTRLVPEAPEDKKQ